MTKKKKNTKKKITKNKKIQKNLKKNLGKKSGKMYFLEFLWIFFFLFLLPPNENSSVVCSKRIRDSNVVITHA